MGFVLLLAAWGCPSSDDGAEPEPTRDASTDTGRDAGANDDSSSAAANVPEGCDMTGAWVAQHVTANSALGAPQLATNWTYLRLEQTGTALRVVDFLDCGYVVRGSTDVSLGDATLEAMAQKSTDAIGVKGTLAPTQDGKGCELAIDRIYSIRGADKAKFLDAVWKPGDAPKELSMFELPKGAADGMQDWDDDGHEGLTQLTGLGDRYTAQLDWHAFHGTLPLEDGVLGRGVLGGEGVLLADYDMREHVSQQTPAILQTSSVPESPGYAQLIRADALERKTSGESPELDTCKAVQAMALQHFGDPAKP